jgi:hypothetical protein
MAAEQSPDDNMADGRTNVSDRSIKEAMDKEAASCQTMAAEQSPDDNMADGRTNVSDRSIKEAMGEEAASCQTMAAEQSLDDNMADGRTNEEVGEQRKANIRKRMALEKEEQEAKMEVRKLERKIAHGTKDEPYFAHKYLSSASVAGKTCSCGHVFGQTAGNYQAWVHYTHADHTKPSVHEREITAKAMAPAKTPRAISSFFNAPSSATAAPALASPVDAPAPLPALPSFALPVVIETVGLDDDALNAEAIGTVAALAVRLATAPPFLMKSSLIKLSIGALT